jgi:hypothetical protein
MTARRLPLVAILFVCGSCAYVSHGTTQTVLIDSVPTNATVELDGEPITTPAKLKLVRKMRHVVIGRNANGAVVQRVIYSEPRLVWMMIDLLMLPVVGNLIDILTGADHELVPEQLTIPLPPEDAGPEFQSLQ